MVKDYPRESNRVIYYPKLRLIRELESVLEVGKLHQGVSNFFENKSTDQMIHKYASPRAGGR